MGSTPSTKNYNYWDNGTIPWVAISDLNLNNNIVYETKKCLTEYGAETMKNRKISQNSILLSFKLSIGKLGIAGREMYCNEAIAYLNSTKSTIPQMYLYYILEGLNLEKYGRGTIGSNGNLNKEILKTIPIPIPKSQEKIQEWVNKISAPYNEKNEKQTQIKELETFIQNRIREIGENEECDEVELGSICEIWCGKNLPKEKAKHGIYNVYGGGNSSYTHNEYNLEGFNTIVSRVGNNSVTLVNERFYLTDNGFSLIVNSDIKKYFGYYILNNKEQIFNAGNGSAQKVISKSQLSKIKIKIPKNKQLIQELESIFQKLETLQNDVKCADELYKQLIQELSQEAIPPQNTNIVVPVTTENVAETQEKIEVNVPKKKVVKKTNNKVIIKPKQLIIEDDEEETF